MTVYVDGLLFLNFAFDFLLLVTTSLVLKRKVSLFRLLLGAFFGSLSILILFFNVNGIQLFILKIYLGIIMNLVTFGFHDTLDFIRCFGVFFVISILFGGFLYFLDLEFSYEHSGLIFFKSGFKVNMIFLFIISPLILYIYFKQNSFFKFKVSNFYTVRFSIGGENFCLKGYLDTGNTLSFKGKMVVFINMKNRFRRKKYYVPYKTISGVNVLECIFVRDVLIEGAGVYDVYLGFSENFKVSGCDILLNGLMKG